MYKYRIVDVFVVVVVVVGLIKTVVMVLFVRKVWLVCFVVDVVVVVGKNKSNSGLVVWRLCCCFGPKVSSECHVLYTHESCLWTRDF